MKLQTELLRKFLDKTTLKGVIENFVLRTTEQGIQADFAAQNILAIHSIIPKGKVSDFKPGEKMMIRDSRLLLQMLRSATGVISVEVRDNFIVLRTEQKAISYAMCDEDYIANKTEERRIQVKEKGVVNSDVLKSAASNTKLLEAGSTVISITKGQLKVVSKGESDQIEETCPIEYADIKGNEYGSYFLQIADVLEDKVHLATKDGFPIILEENSEDMQVSFTLAPLETTES